MVIPCVIPGKGGKGVKRSKAYRDLDEGDKEHEDAGIPFNVLNKTVCDAEGRGCDSGTTHVVLGCDSGTTHVVSGCGRCS